MTSVTAQLVLASRSGDVPSHPGHWLLSAVLIGVLLALVVLFVVVVGSILNSALPPGRKIVWLLFVFCFPVLAWFAWYLIGRPDARRRGPGTAY